MAQTRLTEFSNHAGSTVATVELTLSSQRYQPFCWGPSSRCAAQKCPEESVPRRGCSHRNKRAFDATEDAGIQQRLGNTPSIGGRAKWRQEEHKCVLLAQLLKVLVASQEQPRPRPALPGRPPSPPSACRACLGARVVASHCPCPGRFWVPWIAPSLGALEHRQ